MTITNQNLIPKDGEVFLFEHYFSQQQSRNLYESLHESIQWQQQKIKFFGKWVMQPRLTAWYGDFGKQYTYSGITLEPKQWTSELLQIKHEIEVINNKEFNSALLNLYRDGQDSMGWHSDNEKELGPKPIIGSVSLGVTRKLHLQHKEEKHLKVNLELTSGSYLLMQGDSQNFWRHCVPKQAKSLAPRINITFRYIY